jgi:hypothetical protein
LVPYSHHPPSLPVCKRTPAPCFDALATLGTSTSSPLRALPVPGHQVPRPDNVTGTSGLMEWMHSRRSRRLDRTRLLLQEPDSTTVSHANSRFAGDWDTPASEFIPPFHASLPRCTITLPLLAQSICFPPVLCATRRVCLCHH